MGEIDLSSPLPPPNSEQGGAAAGLLRHVALGGAAAALVSSVSQKARLLPLSQRVGEVGGSLWERSSAVRSTIQAVSRQFPLSYLPLSLSVSPSLPPHSPPH